MIPLIRLKQDREFNDSFRGIIDVFKVAASVQLRQLQGSTVFYEPFEKTLFDSLRFLDIQGSRHPLMVHRADLPSCVVVITSDEGFAGDLNAALVTTALHSHQAARHDELVVLGDRGASRLEELNETFVYFPGIGEEIDRERITTLRRYFLKEYLRGTCGRLLVVYAKYVSLAVQHVEEELLLPCRALFGAGPSTQASRALIEPSVERVMEALVTLWLEFALAKIFLSSKLSELSARVMHLEGSDQELSRTSQQLGLQYVKHLHALADKSIREISTSRIKTTGSSTVHDPRSTVDGGRWTQQDG